MYNYLYITNKKNIEDILTCGICLELYKHPRNLSCGHSFCTTCLFMIKINNSITCPICRNYINFSSNYSIVDLPVDSTITSIIDNSNLSIKNSKLKKSKSLDSLTTILKYNNNNRTIKKYYSNLDKKNPIIHAHHPNINIHNINNIDIDINDNTNNINNDDPRECCTFQ